jgi:hypothetical protein
VYTKLRLTQYARADADLNTVAWNKTHLILAKYGNRVLRSAKSKGEITVVIVLGRDCCCRSSHASVGADGWLNGQ